MKKINIRNNKLAIAIGTLSVITLMAIIYAAFTGQLSINGTANVRDSAWDIHIVESGQLEPSNTLSSSAKVLTKPTVSGLSISDFNVSLTSPGDYIEYTFHVINDGDYDATLSDLDKAGVTCTANGSTSDPEAIKVCNKLEYTLKYAGGADVAEGDTLLSKDTKTLVLTIKYQEFDDPSLLPNTNVSISGLGIAIEYSQGNNKAKVNADGTTPFDYDTYSVGDVITLAGEQYYVIENSDSTKNHVTVLKDNALTVDEINTYGAGHVNRYTYDTVGMANNLNDANNTGGIAYYSSAECGYATPGGASTATGCANEGATNYNNSDIKYVINAWAQAKFTNGELKTIDGYAARLITYDELIDNLGYDPNINSAGIPIANENVPSWVYKDSYYYWTMSQWNNSMDAEISVGGGGFLGSYRVNDRNGAVRPVLNVYKSKISD